MVESVVRTGTHRNDDGICLYKDPLRVLAFHNNPVVFHPYELESRVDLHSVIHDFSDEEFLGHAFKPGADLGEHLHDGDLTPVIREMEGHLASDGPAADHDRLLAHVGVMIQCHGNGDDNRLVYPVHWWKDGYGTGSQDDHIRGLGGDRVRGHLLIQMAGDPESFDLPLRKGVSSSAAVCILMAKAFDAVYELGMFPHELMEVAYRGERLTGSQCGRMDQACIYGKTPVLLTFQKSADVRVEPLFPGRRIEMFFVDLGGRKDTVRILSDLHSAYLRDLDVQRGLGSENERIVRQAYRALNSGDGAWLGELMSQAQSSFDRLVAPASRAQLASPLLHELLAFEPIREHIFGGKGVGSQGDGTAQFVARGAADRDEAMRKIVAAFPEMQCFPLTIIRSARAAGV